MSKLSLLLGLSVLLFCAACGTTGGNSGFGTGSGGSGSFSNSSASGQYTYEVTGWDLTTGALSSEALPFREAGSVTLDGKGNVTAGEDLFVEGSTQTPHSSITGTYSVGSDGTGSATVNFGNGGGIQFGLTVVNSSLIYLSVTAAQPGGTTLLTNGYGTAELQTASALSAAPSGTFAFQLQQIGSVHTSTTTGSSAMIGSFTVSGGTVTGGTEYVNGATAGQANITGGIFNAPDSNGVGTGTLVDSNAVTTSFSYFTVSSTSIRLLSTVTGNIGLGRADAQTGTFSNSSLSGSYAFGAKGDDGTVGLGAIQAVGQFSANGSGGITGGATDSDVDGGPTSNEAIPSGTYAIGASGCGTATLAQGGVSFPVFGCLVSSSSGYFIADSTSLVEAGTFTQQSTSSFANSTTNGQFAIVMDGIAAASGGDTFLDRVGWLRFDGSGNLTLNELVNDNGSATTPGLLSGTYSTSANGRVTGSITSVSSAFVFYLVSGTSGYALQNDTATEIGGNFTKQSQ